MPSNETRKTRAHILSDNALSKSFCMFSRCSLSLSIRTEPGLFQSRRGGAQTREARVRCAKRSNARCGQFQPPRSSALAVRSDCSAAAANSSGAGGATLVRGDPRLRRCHTWGCGATPRLRVRHPWRPSGLHRGRPLAAEASANGRPPPPTTLASDPTHPRHSAAFLHKTPKMQKRSGAPPSMARSVSQFGSRRHGAAKRHPFEL